MDKKNEIIVKDFRRLKTAEQQLLGWTAKGLPQSERLRKLNSIAIHQMSVLESTDQSRNLLKE